MVNRVVLVGRLTRDPELRRTANEVAVATFTLAVDNRTRGADGQRTASFIPCTVFGAAADNTAKYTRKGSLVGVDGRLNQRVYERKDGTKANYIDVICDSVQFLEPKSDTLTDDETVDTTEESQNLDSIDIIDDDLPF